MTYSLVIIPEGASLPEDLIHLFVDAPDVIQKISAGMDKQVIVSVNTRELQMLVEYRDLFDADPIAIIGMQGAMYNTVWNTYVATMKRTTIDAFRASLRESNDVSSQEGADAVTRPDRGARIARLSPRPVTSQLDADESDYAAE